MTPPFLPGEVALLRAINGAHSPFWDAAMFLISKRRGVDLPCDSPPDLPLLSPSEERGYPPSADGGAVCGGRRCPKLDAGEALL